MISKEMIRPVIIEAKYHFVWRINWISPYESMWGIFEKFKYANCATVKVIFNLFGTNYVENLKSQTISSVHRDCIHLSGLDGELVEQVFLMPLIKLNTQNIDRLFGILPNRTYKPHPYTRKDLYVCPECIKTGFHSLFHQFKFLHECPYHQISLHKGCPSCNQIIPFELTDECTKEPFRCLCGDSLLDEKRGDAYIPHWKIISLSDVKSIKVNT